MCVYIDINSHIYIVCTNIAIVLHMSYYIYIVLYYYICVYYVIFCWRMPQLMPIDRHHLMNHPICSHLRVLFKWHKLSNIPSFFVLLPAPEVANPPVVINMPLNVPSNDHPPRPATLGIHPSIEPCRHPMFVKPLPSTQVWHGLQKSMLVKDMECS